MSLQEKIKASQATAIAAKYYALGQSAARRGRRAKDCPFDHPFKSSNWVRGYYSIDKE